LPQVDGDRTLLSQLFQNLIGNAIKFVRGKRPEVRVTCSEANGEIVVGVRDNGIGIEAAGREKLFTTFQRLGVGREFEGTGVGLSIARKAVERHGGRIWVESTPGQGSHFQFVLPGAVLPVPA
jgi:signal transduction histidine kinase